MSRRVLRSLGCGCIGMQQLEIPMPTPPVTTEDMRQRVKRAAEAFVKTADRRRRRR
jgi:hypothetical protein